MTRASAMLHYIDRRDHTLMLRINRWHAPRWIRIWMICATRGGDGWLWYALGVIILLAGGDSRFMAVGAALLAAGMGIATFLRLKKATGRKRPCALEPHCWATLLPPDQFSFPSGHTITAFAVSVTSELVLPGPRHRSVLLRLVDRRLTHPTGHAFPQRRSGRCGNWSNHGWSVGLSVRHPFLTQARCLLPKSLRNAVTRNDSRLNSDPTEFN